MNQVVNGLNPLGPNGFEVIPRWSRFQGENERRLGGQVRCWLETGKTICNIYSK